MQTFQIDNAIEVLQQTPHTLQTLLHGLSEDWILANEGANTWSPYDIIGHLIHGEKTDWMVRLQIILEATNKNFAPFDRFAQFENSKGKSLQELLFEFKILREKNLEKLSNLKLSAVDLQREGIHPEFGKVTAQQLLATWVTHDLGHIAQIARVLAKQYKNEVGPWTAYISILNQ